MAEMIVSGGVRYRTSDAKRLGLIADGKVLTANSTQHPGKGQRDAVVGTPPEGADVPEGDTPAAPTEAQPTDPGATIERPLGNGSKADWTAYAVANGHAEEDLDGKTRDEIAALFDEPGTDNSTEEN